ncbi:TPA: hypothetical protein UMB92_003799 [Stenotrophomonas maltophilia]|nr:hypothetical protein [Stenotrophomonas maltophilia]
MRTPSPSCRRSSPSSLEWRPSRQQAVAQLIVLLATPWLLRASDLPPRLLMPVVLLAWAIGVTQLVWRLRRPRMQVLLSAQPEPLRVAGKPVEAPQLVVRGPWLLLLWREGRRRRRLLFWPDVLDSGQRRELRLAVAARGVSRRPRSMAP